jgi:hypothetical protein
LSVYTLRLCSDPYGAKKRYRSASVVSARKQPW